MSAVPAALDGLNILVTRPSELAATLVALIEQQGGRATLYPVISIVDTASPKDRDNILNRLPSFDIAIFISPTAVAKTFEHLETLPASLQVAAIGSSTEKALNKFNVSVSIRPEGHSSEDLLQHALLQEEAISGKSIVIFRGTEGREQLANTLTSRGGKVSYAEMYTRIRPQDAGSLTDEQLHTLDVIAITSNEGLQNLFDLTTNTRLLTTIPLVVPGLRSRKLADTLGFTRIIQSDNATDAACINALIDWANAKNSPLDGAIS